MSWTQSICVDCSDERNPERKAVALVDTHRNEETCCYCGEPTTSGIYVRADPSTVPFPSVT